MKRWVGLFFLFSFICFSQNFELKIIDYTPFLKINGKDVKGQFVGESKIVKEDNKDCIKIGWFKNKLNYLRFDICDFNIPTEEGYVSFYIKPVDWNSKDNKYHKFFELRGKNAWLLIYHHEGNSLIALMATDMTDRSTWSSASFGLNHDFKKDNWYKIEVIWNKKYIEFKVDDKKTTASVNKPLEGKIDWIAIGPTEQWGRRDYDESTLIEGLTYYSNIEEKINSEREKIIKEVEEKEGRFIPKKINSSVDEYITYKVDNLFDNDTKTFFAPQFLPCELIFDFGKKISLNQIVIYNNAELRRISDYEWYASNDGNSYEKIKSGKNLNVDKIVDDFTSPLEVRYLKLKIIEGNTALVPFINEIKFYKEKKEKSEKIEKKKEGLSFEISTDKITYNVSEEINGKIEIVNYEKKPVKLIVEVFHQPGIKESKKIYKNNISLNPEEKKEIALKIKTDDLYGHLLRGYIYGDGIEIFKDAYFEILDEWKNVIRMSTHAQCGYDMLAPNVNETKLNDMIEEYYKKKGINVIQLYGWIPEFGVLVPEKDTWSNAVYRGKTLTSKNTMKIFKRICEKKGIKVIGYDEPGSREYNVYGPVEFPKDGRRYSIPFYNMNFPSNQPIVIYGANYLPDLNILTGAYYYSEQMKESKKIFNWDGFFIDSLVWLCEITAFGKDKKGNKITDLSCDDLMYNFLKKIRDKVGNEFYITANMGGQEAYPFPPVKEEDVIYRKSHKLIDGWCFEVPPNPQNYKCYPVKWEDLVLTYKNLRDIYKETNFYAIYNWAATWEMSDKNLKALYAITHSSKFGIYYHDARRYYTNFALRYGEILYSKNLIDNEIEIDGEMPFLSLSKNLSYYDTKHNYFVIHLINVNPEKFIWTAKDEYPEIKNKEIEINLPFETKVKKVLLISADDGKNDPVNVDFQQEGKKIKIKIPYLDVWDILIIQN